MATGSGRRAWGLCDELLARIVSEGHEVLVLSGVLDEIRMSVEGGAEVSIASSVLPSSDDMQAML